MIQALRNDLPDIKTWIVQAISAANKTSKEYEDARNYVENEQEPPDVPDDIDYLVDNLITDLIARLHGTLTGTEIDIDYTGAGKYKPALDIVTKAILKETKLQGVGKSHLIDNFLVEGLAGIKFGYLPNVKSIFGMGKPVVYIDDPENILLDVGNLDRFHNDDVLRARRMRIPLEEAKRRWPEKAREITLSSKNPSGSEVEYTDIYEVEYSRVEIFENANGLTEERRVFYQTKYANETTELEPLTKTGFSIFTTVAALHTPRKSEKYGKRPMGVVRRVKSSQDLRNILRSILLEVTKKSTKQLTIITAQLMMNWLIGKLKALNQMA